MIIGTEIVDSFYSFMIIVQFKKWKKICVSNFAANKKHAHSQQQNLTSKLTIETPEQHPLMSHWCFYC